MATSSGNGFTSIPGTQRVVSAGFTPERITFRLKSGKEAPTPECFIEITDRPMFAEAKWAKSRSRLRATCESPLGKAEVRVAHLDSGLIRVEYADNLAVDAERRIRLSCLGDIKITRPLPTRLILECGKKQAIGVHAMISEEIDATPEDDYGLGLRIAATKTVAWVLFIATGKTKSKVEKAFEKIYD